MANTASSALSPRELAVLRAIASGLPRKQIAAVVQLNPHTADFVIRRLYRKLSVNCAPAAVVAVLRGRPPWPSGRGA